MGCRSKCNCTVCTGHVVGVRKSSHPRESRWSYGCHVTGSKDQPVPLSTVRQFSDRGSVTWVLVLALIGSSGTSGNFSFRTGSKRANTSEIWSHPWHGKPSKRWFEISSLSLPSWFSKKLIESNRYYSF